MTERVTNHNPLSAFRSPFSLVHLLRWNGCYCPYLPCSFSHTTTTTSSAFSPSHRHHSSIQTNQTYQTPPPKPPQTTRKMEGWSKLQSSLGSINFASAGTKITKGFSSSVQATRERLGQVAQDEITELPQGVCFLFFSCLCIFVLGENGERIGGDDDDEPLIVCSHGD